MLDGIDDSRPVNDRPPAAVIAAGLALLGAAAIGVLLVFRFVDDERDRDLRAWQARLAIVADTRAAAVNDWVDRQVATVGALADNASLQLYMTELSTAGGDPAQVNEGAAQAGYLRNLLDVAADRAGFTASVPARRLAATIQRPGSAGLALLGGDGRALVATPDLPQLEGRLRDFVRSKTARAVLDIYPGAANAPTMAFIAPVVGVQADPGSKPIGWVLGVKEVADELYPLLARPPASEKSAESLLVRRDGAALDFISPLADGAAPLSRKMAISTPNLAEAFAIDQPGGFGLRRDYRDVEVLVTGRAIAAVPWTLAHKVARAEALAESDARLNRLLAILLLIVAGVAAALLAVWRHGASRRAGEAAGRFRDLARRFEAQGRLLRLVTDSQPASIFIADEGGRIRFANRALAARVGAAVADLAGKTLAAVFGPAEGQRYAAGARDARAQHKMGAELCRVEEGGKTRVMRAEHIPLDGDTAAPGAVLVVEEDVTEVVTERERRERILRELVRALVTLVDRRDPYAAHHSQRVAAVARRIAEEMGLDRVAVETAEIAGNLMNVGKIMVPAPVLTRPGDLSDDELQQVRESLQAGADLLRGIEFDGPVVETLSQSQERWDGGGPHGLKGEAILLPARIVAASNAFVALVSARAHRPGLDFDAAMDTLLKETGSAFDRRVTAALISVLDNRGGRADWAGFAKPAE